KKEASAVAGHEEPIGHAAGALRGRIAHALSLDLDRLELARAALEPLLREVHARLRRAGVETFAALLRDASRLVRENAGAAARIRRGIDQLLVDEFQDTDGLQCEIVERIGLAGGDAGPTLFLVGDPRQSIYGWRSADLRAYDAFAAKVAAAGGARLRLTKNFRSLPAVLAEVKRSLEHHMRPREGVMPAFQDLVPHRRDGEGSVEHWVSWRWDAEAGAPARTRSRDATLLEARAVAADVARLARDEGVALRDVALLLRGLTEVDVYLDALRDAGVPYAVERDRRYYQRREVIEASALLRTVLDPHDHVALVAWLRSASVGVPDAAWTPLWARRFPEALSDLRSDAPEALAPTLEIVREAAAAVDPTIPGLDRLAGWERSLARAVETVAALRAAAERDPSDVFVERLRSATGIELTEASRYLGVYRAANLDQFFRDLRDDLEETGWDVSEVLRRVRRAVEEQAEVEEARPRDAADEAVRVMSIHKSKGLDFPHVYLLQLHKSSAGNRTAVAGVGRGEDGDEYQLFGARTLGFDTADEQRGLTEDAERVRTLYVGMTRPCDRLVVVGKHPVKGDALPRSHAELLATRRCEEEAVEARMARLAAAGGSAERDASGVLWRFPGLEPERAPQRAGAAAGAGDWPSAEEVAAQSRGLAARRVASRARAARPRGQA
ncbi:MAG TPA: 3'-5' exonuclease, partial [Myxococcota bacterium]|nr:3'-5' exonuclease [Myxococcota bacterium]